ncbi:hypothetical protein CFAM422_002834 [Trichoderma lentiforme]|uniref:Uncharacterized protein n=1 Tax=Trichoderma lentiforme TaxID=1567552 RepID=A0A9P5CHJ7_9HYPO|nr:hypothetical protein CFAM422_002834 [Trichoderma lentiforme]
MPRPPCTGTCLELELRSTAKKQRQKDPLRVHFPHTQQGHDFCFSSYGYPPHRRKHDDDGDYDDAGD